MPDDSLIEEFSYDQLNDWNKLLRSGVNKHKCLVATHIQAMSGYPAVKDVQEADTLIRAFFQAMLDNEQYLPMAVLIGGRDYIDERSEMVKRVFDSLHHHALNSIPGASSLSKTFGATIWHGMDWLRDPANTAIRFAGVNDTNLKAFLFNGLRRFMENSAIPLNLYYANLYIGLNAEDKEGSISGVTFPQDSTETGRFKGFHPVPRIGGSHPKFGTRTRIRLLLDEASNMPDGVRQDLSSMESSIDDIEHVKITACFNPHDEGHWTGRISAPRNGLALIDPETDHDWVSQEGWKVTRLDGKYCENVVARKTVIPSMMSYDFFKKKEALGGDNPIYWIYARGIWPRKGSYAAVIPRYLLENRKVTPLFIGPVTNCAACDPAISSDRIVLTSFRWGLARGLIDTDGKHVMFDSNNPNPNLRRDKQILWIEQCFEVKPEKKDTIVIAQAIRDACVAMQVRPRDMVIDSTGNGVGIFHWLRTFWGDVLGLGWGNKATEIKIMADDDEKLPIDTYANLSTEMWYATRTWLEYDNIFFSPDIQTEPLFSELSKRRIPLQNKNRAGKLLVESKDIYKGREGASPDYADSCIQAQELIRMRSNDPPSKTDKPAEGESEPVVTVHEIDSLEGTFKGQSKPDSGSLKEWVERQTGRLNQM